MLLCDTTFTVTGYFPICSCHFSLLSIRRIWLRSQFDTRPFHFTQRLKAGYSHTRHCASVTQQLHHAMRHTSPITFESWILTKRNNDYSYISHYTPCKIWNLCTWRKKTFFQGNERERMEDVKCSMCKSNANVGYLSLRIREVLHFEKAKAVTRTHAPK